MLPILLALAFIVLLFAVVIAGQPKEFKVCRSTHISAPPEAVFSHVNDFHRWEAWSPWAKLDPSCKNTFEGAAVGTGAIFSWVGNKKVGEGRMTIMESLANDVIRINLEFFKPFKATNTAEFIFRREGNQTIVTWSMAGKNNFMGRIFSLIVNCDNMVGRDFEKGLAAMKSVVEAQGRG